MLVSIIFIIVLSIGLLLSKQIHQVENNRIDSYRTMTT